ncbi:hypothetical protein CQW23_09845 [Capsicum baccatum]|uniref:Uncharacterized protein n=1 Tax=Capsicum baccatum TaxID=33114 RepID=A0A2G2WXY7_CAPBA|nr:hypothetical protein CQW23_09845 [Capsicum baccatum]
MFFFEKLNSIVVDGPDLCFISDRHKNIANGIAKAYNHAHHGFDVMTRNITKSVNAMLIDEREYPVASIFNSIAKSFSEIFKERHTYVLKCKDNKFVPTAEKIVRDNMSEGESFYVENISGDEKQYTVFGSRCTAKVNYWKGHVLAKSLKHSGSGRVYDYSLPLYKVEEYLLAYSKSINVVPLESEWRLPQELLDMNIIPPLVVTKLGRKKRKCVKGMGDNFKSKRRNKCSLCKRPRHNRTTYNTTNRS